LNVGGNIRGLEFGDTVVSGDILRLQLHGGGSAIDFLSSRVKRHSQRDANDDNADYEQLAAPKFGNEQPNRLNLRLDERQRVLFLGMELLLNTSKNYSVDLGQRSVCVIIS